MKTFAFKNRLFKAYAAMTVVIVVLFAVLMIHFTASFNHETELRHQQQVFEGNLAQVEAFLEQANRLAMMLASNHEILSMFISLDEPNNVEGGGVNYFDENLLDAIRISSLLSGVNVEDEFADLLAVFNRYGDYVSAGRLYDPPERIQQTISQVSTIDALTGEIREREEHCLVLDRNLDSDLADSTDTYFTLYRTLSYTNTSKPYGLVSVQLNSKYLRGLDIWGDAGGDEYFLINDWNASEPRLMFLDTGDVDVNRMYLGLSEKLSGTSGEVAQLPWRVGERDVILFVARAKLSNWLLVRALPVASISQPYMQSYWLMALGCLMLLVLLLFVVNYMAERISRPLRQLSANISAIGLQNLSLPDEDEQYSTRELASLDKAFRQMLSRLDQSIAVELQAYMRVLQSQMNPHFLYNTLSVVVASSESHGDRQTASMCLKLTDMLRYVVDIKRETVTFEAELEHTRNYLDLMKERYEQLFSYEIDADKEALLVAMPRLTVQPLVENCFVHGFKNAPPWHVQITVRIKGGNWHLSVIDNGVGVTPEALQAIEARFEEYRGDVAGHYQDLSLGGMGLINSRLRLMLMFGETLEYSMQNRPEGGLVIEIGGPIR